MAKIGGLGGLGGMPYEGVKTQDELFNQMQESRRGARAASSAALQAIPDPRMLANATGFDLYDAQQALVKANGATPWTSGDPAWDARVRSVMAGYYGQQLKKTGSIDSQLGSGGSGWGNLANLGAQAEKMGYSGPNAQEIARYGLNKQDYRQAQASDLAPWNRDAALRYGFEPAGFGNYQQRITGVADAAQNAFYSSTPGALSPDAFAQQAQEADQAKMRVNDSYQQMQGGSFFGGMLNDSYGKPAPGWGSGDATADTSSAPAAGGEGPVGMDPNAEPTQFGAWRPEQQFTAGWGKKGSW